MLVGGIGPSLIRLQPSPDEGGSLKALLTVGRIVEAEVVSVTADRALLTIGRGNRLEVRLQFPVVSGQRLQLQVVPEGDGAALVPLPATPASDLPLPAPQLPVWLPIPLPQGAQGWAQLSVSAEPDRTPGESSMPVGRQIRIWWETPALGKVEVQLTEHAGKLAAVFTVPSAQSRDGIDAHLAELRQQFTAIGFPDAVLGSRPPRPGETLEPVGGERSGLLDQRI